MTMDKRNYPHSNYKRSRPFGMPATPFNPLTGRHMGFTDNEVFGRRAQLVSEGDNSLMVYFYRADGTLDEDVEVEVAKPIGLRRQDYEGEEYDGATYAYVSADERTATVSVEDEDDVVYTHNIIPSYRAETDLYVFKPFGLTGVLDEDEIDVEWQDAGQQRWWLESAE